MGYDSCVYCGRWHSPRFPTCFKCRAVQGREEAAESLRYLILCRDNSQCQECGDSRLLQVDHIVPCARGGNAEEWNLRVLCADCNWNKGSSWHVGCVYERVKTELARGYFLIQALYFTPEMRQRFRAEVALWRATGTWDVAVQKRHANLMGATEWH